MPDTAPATQTIPTTCPSSSGTLLKFDLNADPPMLQWAVPHTDYQLHLVLDGPLPDHAKPGSKLTGTLHAQALRVDQITAGGRYVEPSEGRPRRVQGTVVGGCTSENSGDVLFVKAGAATLACTLTDKRQSLADFTLHEMVSFDVKRGASFRAKK